MKALSGFMRNGVSQTANIYLAITGRMKIVWFWSGRLRTNEILHTRRFVGQSLLVVSLSFTVRET
jgi:hypothetical protein